MPLGAFLVLPAAVFVFHTIISEPADDHYFFSEVPSQLWVIALQGVGGLWPGNTMYAFEQAADMGADGIITDYPDRLMTLLDR